jgi:hypothetical protein
MLLSMIGTYQFYIKDVLVSSKGEFLTLLPGIPDVSSMSFSAFQEGPCSCLVFILLVTPRRLLPSNILL